MCEIGLAHEVAGNRERRPKIGMETNTPTAADCTMKSITKQKPTGRLQRLARSTLELDTAERRCLYYPHAWLAFKRRFSFQ